jgi:hypothetical protein
MGGGSSAWGTSGGQDDESVFFPDRSEANLVTPKLGGSDGIVAVSLRIVGVVAGLCRHALGGASVGRCALHQLLPDFR